MQFLSRLYKIVSKSDEIGTSLDSLRARFWSYNFSATKIELNCATKIACVNEPLDRIRSSSIRAHLM